MQLYHYTHRDHLATILMTRFLKVTESNISFHAEHAGPDVVWLTDQDNPRFLGSMLTHVWDKTSVRITVDVPDAHHWPTWSRAHGISEDTYRALARKGMPKTWYVVERPIRSVEWVEIIDPWTGQVLVDPKEWA